MTTLDPMATTVNCNYCGNAFAKERHLRKHVRKSHFRLAAAEELELSPRSKKQKTVIDDQSEEDPHKEETDPVTEGDTGADDEAETSEHKDDQLDHCESPSINTEEDSCVNFKEDKIENEDEDLILDEECITETEFIDATGELPEGEKDAEAEVCVPAEEILDEVLDIVVDLAEGRRTPSVRSSRRSRRTPVTYNENSDDEDSLQYRKKKSKESQAKKSPPLKMKKEAEASIIIDDESFQLLESRMNEQKGKKGKRRFAAAAMESTITSTPLVAKSRETRRSVRTPVSYNEDSDEEKSYSKLSIKQLAKINKKAEENAERIMREMQQSGRKGNNPRIKQAVNKDKDSDEEVSRRIDNKSRTNQRDNASKRTRRSCRNSASISYVETSDDEDEVEIVEEARPSRRGRGRPSRQSREPSSDIVLDGEAVTGSLEDAALLTLADSVYGVEAEEDEEDPETVEITPLASRLGSRRSGDRSVRPARVQGKRYDCGLCHEIVFGELKMNLHMKLKHRMSKSNSKKQVQNIVKSVKVMIKNEKLKPTKPKPSLHCTFRKCKSKFSEEKDLERHKEDVHLYKCTQCIGTIIFETKSVFEAHTQKYHVRPCPECGLVFTSEERLRSHKAEVHPHCEVCEDDFSWPSPGHSCHLTRGRGRRV